MTHFVVAKEKSKVEQLILLTSVQLGLLTFEMRMSKDSYNCFKEIIFPQRGILINVFSGALVAPSDEPAENYGICGVS